VILNLLALSAIAYLATHHSPPATQPVDTTAASTPTTANSTPRSDKPERQDRADSPVRSSAPSSRFQWNQVESEDYKKYIANLRAIGCPEETIKDIIIADINKLYAPRIAALNPTPRDYKYWEARSPYGMDYDRDKQRQQREVMKEKKNLIMELLGVDTDEETRKLYGNIDYYERTLGFLSKDKREIVKDLQQKYSDLEQDIYRKSEGRIYPEDEAEFKKIRDARHAELAKVLTPQELEEYEVRNSNTANQMRYDLASFDASEDEVRKIFRLRDQFESEFGRAYSPLDPEDRDTARKRAEAQKKMDDELKAELGPRYDEYQRSRDYSYQELARLSKRYDLPKDTAVKVWDMKKAAEQQASKVRVDSTLAPDQRQAALKAIRDETEKTLSDSLGQSAFKAYKRSGGYWLNSISTTAITRVISP